MAEALVNHFRDQWQAISAGTQPTGYIHPYAIAALKDIGIEVLSPPARSKSVDEFRNVAFDLVVTVCDDAAENCPVWLGSGKREHVSFPDPAKVIGAEDQMMGAFCSLRDDMMRRIMQVLDQEEWLGRHERIH
jgi:arsenate reductase